MTAKRKPLAAMAAEASTVAAEATKEPAKKPAARKPAAKKSAATKPATTKAPAKTRTVKAASAKTKPAPLREIGPEGLKATNLRLPIEMHKRLQFQRIEEGRPVNDIIVQAIHEYLRRASGPARK